MERRYGRDLGLSVRMGIALVLLGLFYLPFLLAIALIGFFASSSVTVGLALAALALAALPFTPGLSERLVLRSAGARLLPEDGPSHLRSRVERLCALADLPVPRLALAGSDVPNAFSAGRTRHDCVVVVTTGLLERLSESELDAVLAHELAHVANRDALSKIGGTLLVLYLLPFLFMGWLVCAFATLLVMTVSRYREYAADRGAALITGEPESVMSALQAVGEARRLIPAQDLRSASAFLFVPLDGGADWFEVDPLRMFTTHPPV